MGRISRGKVKWFVLAGLATAGLFSLLAMNSFDKRPAGIKVIKGVKVKNTDRTRAMFERAKDRGIYYSTPTMKKLATMAKNGDEWAMREIAWPEGHEFHKKGRPFFRNNGPHPDGLKFYSGFVGDDGDSE